MQTITNRTVELCFTQDQQEGLTKTIDTMMKEVIIDAVENNMRLTNDLIKSADTTSPRGHFHMALSYLATWAMPTDVSGYNHVRVHIVDTGLMGEPEMEARYYREQYKEGELSDYTITAIWHGTRWGFHS